MPYTAEELRDIAEKYALWHGREDQLTTALLAHNYRTEAAVVIVKHGLIRRLKTLCHCMDRVFQHIGPDAADADRKALLDATAYLQTFIINVYGVLDNLARVWISETGLQENGKPVARGHIGLGPNFKTVRDSLPKRLQDHLARTDDWFKYLENYRHALAHRIPLYIPPRHLDEEAEARWQCLEEQMAAASRAHQHELWDQLCAERNGLGVFEPVMMHSFGREPDDARPVHFHGQMICDLATVIEIGDLMLASLQDLVEPAA